MLEMWALAFTTNHQQPFPIPQYCGNGNLPSAASAAQTNYIMRLILMTQETLYTKHSSYLFSRYWRWPRHFNNYAPTMWQEILGHIPL